MGGFVGCSDTFLTVGYFGLTTDLALQHEPKLGRVSRFRQDFQKLLPKF